MKAAVAIIFIAILIPDKSSAQLDSDLNIGVYGGGSFLTGTSEYSESYYEDLRIGANYGSHAILFFGNVGIGINYDKSNFAASGGTLSGGEQIDERYKLNFMGGIVASKVELSAESHLVFYVAYGLINSKEEIIVDGTLVEHTREDYAPKFMIIYEYHFSDFSINCGMQFVNEEKPFHNRRITKTVNSGFGISSQSFHSAPPIDFDRLSFSIGISYHISDLFL